MTIERSKIMSKIASIVHWHCQKVLPLVYDDSLSYYEMVCKLVAKCNEIIEQINGYDDVINELREALVDISDMKIAIDRINTAIDTINSRIDEQDLVIKSVDEYAKALSKRVDANEESISALSEMIGNFNSNVDKKLEALEKKLTDLFNSFTADFTDELQMLQLKVNQMKVNLQAQIDVLRERLDELDTDVINPWHDEMGRISQAKNIKLVYNDLADSVPTATEYDKLNLTADEYSAFGLTALEYARRGKELLHYYWVYSPAYGWLQEISNVFTSVLNFICNTLTANEYSLKTLTADEYSALDLTADDYYWWRGGTDDRQVRFDGLFTGLSVAQYRHLNAKTDGNVVVSSNCTGITSNQYNKLSLDGENNLQSSDSGNGIDRYTYERLGVSEQ